jgi:ribosomal protein S18 acetylase RimI-like enzyme
MGTTQLAIVDLPIEDRERAVPVVLDGFTGIYRWHAKRTLRQIDRVRAAVIGPDVVGVAMLDRLTPEVGYVYYLAVAAGHRREGIGARLLDDALAEFRRSGLHVVYGAAEEDNAPSIRLFESRGFRLVERHERGYAEGGLGAWGLRSRMMLVHGEVLLGLRLDAPARPGPSD